MQPRPNYMNAQQIQNIAVTNVYGHRLCCPLCQAEDLQRIHDILAHSGEGLQVGQSSVSTRGYLSGLQCCSAHTPLTLIKMDDLDMMDADLAVSLADGSFEAFSPLCCSQQPDSKSSNLAVGNLALKDNPEEDETIPGIADSNCANHGNDDSLHCDEGTLNFRTATRHTMTAAQMKRKALLILTTGLLMMRTATAVMMTVVEMKMPGAAIRTANMKMMPAARIMPSITVHK